uniref:C3H1-type domain-containing protein n=1 Tax=Ascaris lumbricoides TaxID=6252 RepID=A0A0M3IQT3_ASCLU
MSDFAGVCRHVMQSSKSYSNCSGDRAKSLKLHEIGMVDFADFSVQELLLKVWFIAKRMGSLNRTVQRMEGDEVLSGSEAGEELHERYDDTQDERDWELSERSGGEEDDGLSDGQPDADAELDYDEENKDDYEQREHVVAQHQHISAPNEGSVITSDDGRGSRFDDDGSSITAEDAESANIEEHGESERPQSNTNSKADGEGLEDGGRNEPSSRQGREPSEEGEIDDLEEGELKSDSDFEVPLLKAPSRSPKEERVKRRDAYRSPEHQCHDEDPQSMGVCRFYLRGTCTWGRDCKYIHPRETRGDMAPPAQSSSSELTWSTGGSPRVRTRSRDRGRPPRESVHSRVKYPNVGSVGVQEAAVVRSGAQESAWERGLRQAREVIFFDPVISFNSQLVVEFQFFFVISSGYALMTSA